MPWMYLNISTTLIICTARLVCGKYAKRTKDKPALVEEDFISQPHGHIALIHYKRIHANKFQGIDYASLLSNNRMNIHYLRIADNQVDCFRYYYYSFYPWEDTKMRAAACRVHQLYPLVRLVIAGYTIDNELCFLMTEDEYLKKPTRIVVKL